MVIYISVDTNTDQIIEDIVVTLIAADGVHFQKRC